MSIMPRLCAQRNKAREHISPPRRADWKAAIITWRYHATATATALAAPRMSVGNQRCCSGGTTCVRIGSPYLDSKRGEGERREGRRGSGKAG